MKWWGIGNEMYGDWQLGHMPLPEYIKKHNRVVDAMRAVDPAMKPVAVGAVGDWTKEMMTHGAGHMELLSEHTYWQDKDDVPAHVAQPVDAIRKIAEAHRAYRRDLPSLKGKDIRIALDEWNYWYGPNEYGELGTRYFLQDGLGIAAGLHEMFRNSDLFFMANYAQTVNVIGAIKTTKTQAEMEPTGLVLQLYRRHFGTVPVEVSGAPAPLDASAALTADGRALTVGRREPDRSAAAAEAGRRGQDRGRRRPAVGDQRARQVGLQPAGRAAAGGHRRYRRGDGRGCAGRAGAERRAAQRADRQTAGFKDERTGPGRVRVHGRHTTHDHDHEAPVAPARAGPRARWHAGWQSPKRRHRARRRPRRGGPLCEAAAPRPTGGHDGERRRRFGRSHVIDGPSRGLAGRGTTRRLPRQPSSFTCLLRRCRWVAGYASSRDQLDRASTSIVLNIAEAAGRRGTADCARFFAIGTWKRNRMRCHPRHPESEVTCRTHRHAERTTLDRARRFKC